MRTVSKKLFIAVLSTILGLCCVFLLVRVSEPKITDAEIKIEVSDLDENYAYNSSKVFSEKINVSYSDGKTYEAKKGVLVFPDGIIKSVSDEAISLDVLGKYFLKYYFTADDGTFITVTDNFNVFNSSFDFSNDTGSSVAFAESTEEICKNNDDNILFTGKKGAIIRINSGSAFKYNVPVDLSNAGADGLTEVIALDPRLDGVGLVGDANVDANGYVIDQDGNYKLDAFGNKYTNRYDYYFDSGLTAENLVLRMTDCYDSNKYIEIVFDYLDQSYGHQDGIIYMRANLSGTSDFYGGFIPSETQIDTEAEKVIYQDNVRGFTYINRWGVYYDTRNYVRTDTPLSIFYDNVEQRLYYRRIHDGVDRLKLIVDFKNTDIYKDAFEGFTTGEVYLSLSAQNYMKDQPARVDVLSIGGSNDFFDNLQAQGYVDNIKPIVDVLVEKTNSSGVYVAKNETVTIPQVKVTDINYGGDLAVRVYRNYGTSNQSIVSVTNNAFKADYLGVYTIVYSATDLYGNTGTATLSVVVKDTDKSLKLTVEKLEQAYFGEYAVLPEHLLETINNSDNLKLSISVIYNGEKTEIDRLTRIFKPINLGEHIVEYSYSDGFVNDVFSYSLNVVAKENVVFLDTPLINTHYIKDAEYYFEPIYAFVKQSNGTYQKEVADCLVSFDGGAFTKVSDINKVKITGSQDLAVKFAYEQASSDIVTAKIVDVGFAVQNGLELHKYFVGDYSVKVFDTDGQTKINNITYESNVLTGNNSLRFVNPVSYQDFRLEYLIPEGKGNFAKFNLIITDRQNSDNLVKISIRPSGTGSAVSINGLPEFTIAEKFCGGNNIVISYKYDRGYFIIGGTKYACDTSLNGDLVYVDLEMEGIYGTSAITVKMLNNVAFSNYTTSDSFNPEIFTDRLYAQYEINKELTLAPMYVGDVLSPIDITSRTLRVVSPSGKTLTSKDGLALNGSVGTYKENTIILLSEYGDYTISYEAKDVKGNSMKLSYKVTVVDKVAPTITFDGSYNEKTATVISVGNSISVKFAVDDNLTLKESIETQVNIYDNRLGSFLVNVGTNIKFEQTGTYTIYVYAKDADGNSAYRYFKVIVK